MATRSTLIEYLCLHFGAPPPISLRLSPQGLGQVQSWRRSAASRHTPNTLVACPARSGWLSNPVRVDTRDGEAIPAKRGGGF